MMRVSKEFNDFVKQVAKKEDMKGVVVTKLIAKTMKGETIFQPINKGKKNEKIRFM